MAKIKLGTDAFRNQVLNGFVVKEEDSNEKLISEKSYKIHDTVNDRIYPTIEFDCDELSEAISSHEDCGKILLNIIRKLDPDNENLPKIAAAFLIKTASIYGGYEKKMILAVADMLKESYNW